MVKGKGFLEMVSFNIAIKESLISSKKFSS